VHANLALLDEKIKATDNEHHKHLSTRQARKVLDLMTSLRVTLESPYSGNSRLQLSVECSLNYNVGHHWNIVMTSSTDSRPLHPRNLNSVTKHHQKIQCSQ